MLKGCNNLNLGENKMDEKFYLFFSSMEGIDRA